MSSFTTVIIHPVTNLVVYGYTERTNITVSKIVIGTNADSMLRNEKGIDETGNTPVVIKRLFEDYLDGNDVDFSDLTIDYGKHSEFEVSVLKAAGKVLYGRVCSYSELAILSGYPKAIRAAASVMRKNHVPLLIPCHRIVKKNGNCGSYCGYTKGCDALLKRKLIALESHSSHCGRSK